MKRNENSEELGRFGRFLGRLVWLCMILAAIALVVLAIWGIIVTAAAVDRGETWAQVVAAMLFLVAFLLILRDR